MTPYHVRGAEPPRPNVLRRLGQRPIPGDRVAQLVAFLGLVAVLLVSGAGPVPK